MLNLNYNINNAIPLSRPGSTAPYNVQYMLVAGGGGSAGGDNNLKVGQAGSGGELVSGGFCIQPASAYSVTIGSGGLGGQRSATFPNYTGSNGGNSVFSSITALGGVGGIIQSEPTASFYAGNGIVSASFGNGGDGGQWTINLPGLVPNGYIGGTAGEYITTNYYGGGGAGFNVNTLNVEFIAVAGGGAGASQFSVASSGGGGAGGIVTGSFAAQPVSQSYSIIVGNGGPKGTQSTEDGAEGSPSSVFGYSASGGKGGFSDFNGDGDGGTAGSGSNFPNIGGTGTNFGGGGGGTATTGSSGGSIIGPPIQYFGGNGGDGTEWLDGIKYGAGGYGAYTPGAGAQYFGSYGSGSVYGRGGGGGLSAAPGIYAGESGSKGTVIIRYPGSGSKATGGDIFFSGSYTYHQFTSSGTFTVLETPQLLTGGTAGLGGAGLTGSNAIPNTGGGAGGSYYTESGSLGGSGFFAIRYEGQIVGATGGEIINTQHYTYHIFTASGDFYSGEGNTQNKNINPCP